MIPARSLFDIHLASLLLSLVKQKSWQWMQYVYGATLFPQNIGLGATHDPALITQVEQVTRDEVLGTGIHWTFAPCVCTPQDIRWGRTYEGYSEVPSDNATDGSAAIVGFQGPNGQLGPTNILATAKHFIGDGHTAWGTGSP